MLNVTVGIRLFLYLIGLFVWFKVYKTCNPKRFGEPIAWFAWLIHGVIYCIVFLIDYRDTTIDAQFYNYWQTAIGYQVIITVIVIGYSYYHRLRGPIGC